MLAQRLIERETRRRMATRTVAGGRVRSARPPVTGAMWVRPRMGSRIKYQAAWIPSATAAAVGKSGAAVVPAVARFARTAGYRTW